MVTLGVLYSYALGAVLSSWRVLAWLCIVPVAAYSVLMFFAKESPSYLLFKGKEERATAALQHFRGNNTLIMIKDSTLTL